MENCVKSLVIDEEKKHFFANQKKIGPYSNNITLRRLDVIGILLIHASFHNVTTVISVWRSP